MRREQEMVEAFHRKHGFPVGQMIGQDPKTDLVRSHLIQEETAELVLALAEGDYMKVADSLGDLMYVVLGAAITYGIPATEVFNEIHRSNMTKAVRDPGDTRLRNKGDSYVPPDIADAMTVGKRAMAFPRPKVICLCGSTRFKDEFIKANKTLTGVGIIVLSVGMFGHDEGMDMSGELKQQLDELHKRKIDLSDEVLVLNVGGYIGESTRSEIEYATARHVPVNYLEDVS